jgi:hypothetical protein
MPNACLLPVTRYEEGDYTADADLSDRLFAVQASPKDEWQEYFSRSCNPQLVQTSLGRVQKVGAEAYAERFAPMKAIFISWSRHALRDKLFYALDSGISVSATIHESPSRADLEGIIASIEVQFPEEIAGKISAAIRQALEKFKQLPSSTRMLEADKETRAPGKAAFLDSARRLEALGHIDKALDMVYGHFDSLLTDHDYARADALLASIEPKEFGTDLLLGFLTITLPAKQWLESRAVLFRKIEKDLRTRKDWENNMLAGLEQ